MQKTLIAMTLTTLLAASANAATVFDKDGQKFDVYGRLQGKIYDKTAASAAGPDEDKTTLKGDARFGLKGSQAIVDGLSGIAKGEWQIAAEGEDDSKFTTRDAYVGLDGSEKGTLIFGRTDTAYYDVLAVTDYFNEWGDIGNAYTGRQDGQIIYHGAWNGFSAAASYQFFDSTAEYSFGPEEVVKVIENAEKDYGYGATLGYSFPVKVSLLGGLSKDAFKTKTTNESWDKNDWALGASYGVVGEAGLYAAALYNQSSIEGPSAEADGTGYEFMAIYRLPSNVSFLGGYNKLEWDAKQGAVGVDADLVDEFLLGAQYDFSSQFLAFAEYAINQVEDADDRWVLGLQYSF